MSTYAETSRAMNSASIVLSGPDERSSDGVELSSHVLGGRTTSTTSARRRVRSAADSFSA
eukprot:5958668-Prymnesium_polylepis.1